LDYTFDLSEEVQDGFPFIWGGIPPGGEDPVGDDKCMPRGDWIAIPNRKSEFVRANPIALRNLKERGYHLPLTSG
jgi:hypothetical protein